MKILHIVETCWGGCGTYLNELVPLQIDEPGVTEVLVLAPLQHRAHLSRIAESSIVTFHRPGRLKGLFRLTTAVRKTLREFRPDVIHAHSTFAGAIVRALAYGERRPPIVYCPHGWAFEFEQPAWRRTVTRLAERALSRRCRTVVAISEAERRQGIAAGIAAEKIALVPNGIRDLTPPPVEGLWDDRRLKVLFVGRLDRQKGVDILIDAVTGLEDRISVRIIGESVLSGARSAHASAPASPKPPPPHVRMLGWLDQTGVHAQMAACDVAIMPSRWEGFGLVAIEAMRAGKPVLASSVGGLREIVVEDVTGNLFPVGDAAAIRSLLIRYAATDLKPIGENARRRFLAVFTSDRTHQLLMTLYRNALGLVKIAAQEGSPAEAVSTASGPA